MQTDMIINAERQPVVRIVDGGATANSRDVADYFGKNHRDVMKAIDNLVQQEPSLCLRSFAQTSVSVPMPNGGTREDRQFDMDRRGFTLLAMGFTGQRALGWKLRYIDAFDAMEAELRRVASGPAALDPNDPAQLRALLIDYSDRALALEGRVAELEPKEAALDRIYTAKGSFCVTDAAKALQVQPKDLFAFLRANRWIYRRFGSTRDRAFEDKILAGLLEHKVTEPDRFGRTYDQVRVTPKGLAKLAQAFAQPLLIEHRSR